MNLNNDEFPELAAFGPSILSFYRNNKNRTWETSASAFAPSSDYSGLLDFDLGLLNSDSLNDVVALSHGSTDSRVYIYYGFRGKYPDTFDSVAFVTVSSTYANLVKLADFNNDGKKGYSGLRHTIPEHLFLHSWSYTTTTEADILVPRLIPFHLVFLHPLILPVIYRWLIMIKTATRMFFSSRVIQSLFLKDSEALHSRIRSTSLQYLQFKLIF